ncbi:MAG: carbon-nitrogen hydrolase family protein, partial [Planctomycetes bacterium]|nr:carbon-nitrogen hydrolase family protein [Planctomycetota bacterium]
LVVDLTVRSDWAQKPAEPRTIKLGAVCLPPNPQRDLAAGREAVCNAIAACAKLGADLVCLPENCFAGGALDAQATSVPVATGDGLAVVAGLCLANRLWAVLPIYRQNSHTGRHESVALLFDRQGRLAGQYVKTHLNEFERTRFDLAPGDALPVFQADFGKFGLLLGEDFLQPEAGRALFLQGAEVLCWAGSPMPFFPSARMLKLLTSSRAIDNFAHVAASNFETEPPWRPGLCLRTGCVVEARGTVAADTAYRPGVAVAPVTLPASRPFYGSFGAPAAFDLRLSTLRQRRPHLFAACAT